MSLGQIIDAIWNLPWYKVIAIAVIDDFIVLVKIWPAYLVLLALLAVVVIVTSKGGLK